VQLTRKLPPGMPAEAFTPLTRPGPVITGRFAQVSDEAAVTSREDVLRVIAEMRDDLAGTGAREWENPNLERFLEAPGFSCRPRRLLRQTPLPNPAGACSPRHSLPRQCTSNALLAA
jgi:hypothetical protein